MARMGANALQTGRLFRAVLLALSALCFSSNLALSQCKPGDILVGEDKDRYYCKNRATHAKCVRQAGIQLKQDREEGCARVVGNCFVAKKTPLSIAAVACVAGCRQVLGCPIACGLAGLGVEAIVEECIDQRNSCFEAASTRHRQAVEACKR
jgi:hypothetical protein